MGIAFPAEPCSGSQSFSIKAEKAGFLADSFAADTGACDLCCILKVTPPGGEPRAKPLWEAAGLPQVGTLGAPVSQSSGGTTQGAESRVQSPWLPWLTTEAGPAASPLESLPGQLFGKPGVSFLPFSPSGG